MNPPLISVIIPTYNRADLIGETLRSVLDQTYPDFEIIVVDNGSTDNTEEVVRSFNDLRIRYHWQENSGLPANSRNVGIVMAKGQWVAFLDSDDLWLPRKLELQVRCFEDHPDAGLVYGDAVTLGGPEEGKSILRGGFVEGDIFQDQLKYNHLPTLTVMVKKSCLDEMGVFDESPELRGHEDYELFLRVLSRFKAYAVKTVVARYRIHPSNLSLDGAKRVEQSFIVLEKVKEKLHLSDVLLARAYSYRYAQLAWNYYKSGDEEKYSGAYEKAMGYAFNPSLFLFYWVGRLAGRDLTLKLMRRLGYP